MKNFFVDVDKSFEMWYTNHITYKGSVQNENFWFGEFSLKPNNCGLASVFEPFDMLTEIYARLWACFFCAKMDTLPEKQFCGGNICRKF